MAQLKLVALLLAWCMVQVLGDATSLKITIRNSTTIKSPNHPSKYPPNTTVEWLLQDDDGVGKWELFFTGDIEIELSKNCLKDYLEIIEDDLPKRLCGKIQGLPSFRSKNPRLKIVFKTDGHIQDKGFTIRVIHIIDKEGIRKLKEMGDGLEGKNAFVKPKEKKTSENSIFIALVTILAVAVFVFVILLICLVIGVYNKRRQRYRTNPKTVIKHIQFAVSNPPPASNLQMPRRYSRPSSITDRQEPHSLPLTHKTSTSSRGPLLSTGSIRYS